MTRWWPVFRREFAASLQSPALWIFAAVFFALAGVLFNQALSIYSAASQGNPTALEEMGESALNVTDFLGHNLFGILFILLLFAAPFLTMRLLAEEKKLGTYDLLLSYPLREIDIVLGKFFAAWAISVGWLALSLLYPTLIWWISGGNLEWPAVAAGYTGLLFVSAAFIALGLLASCLTENQLVAGLLTLGVLLLGIMLSSLAPADSQILGRVLRGIDIFDHADWAMRGVLRAGDLSFFAIVTIGALFLAQRALAFRRLGVIR